VSIDHRLIGLLLIAALPLGVAGCNGGVITFTVTEESDEHVVEGSDNPLEDFVAFDKPFTFDINLEQKLEKRDADGAKEIRLRELEMEVTDSKSSEGDTDNFDFLDSIEFYVNSENQDRKRVAWLDDVPTGRQTLTLNTDESINLKPYIEEGMTLESEADAEQPDDDTSIKGIVTLWIRAL